MNQYHGQHEFDRFLFERYFQCGAERYIEPSGDREMVIECGALDGRELSNGLFFEESLGWRAINVEAAQRAFESLMVNRPKALNLHVALDFREGPAVFWDAVHPLYGHLSGNGALDHTSEHRAQLESEGYTFESYGVQTMRYSCLMHILGFPAVDLMVLDVEGAEMRVLMGMKDALVSMPRVLAIEADKVSPKTLDVATAALGYTFDAQHHDNRVYILREFA